MSANSEGASWPLTCTGANRNSENSSSCIRRQLAAEEEKEEGNKEAGDIEDIALFITPKLVKRKYERIRILRVQEKEGAS